MFIFLSKFLPLFVYPLGLACLLILAGVLIRRPGWRRTALILAFSLLYLGGNHWVAQALARSLEWRYLPAGEIETAPVIVVLAGGVLTDGYPRAIPELDGTGDRVIYAAHLYHQGAAPLLLLAGGRIDWISPGPDPGADTAFFLQMLGVPPEALRYELDSRNTYETALNCRELLFAMGIQRIILLTSASHMPRSVGLFERQGFEVIPAPTDFTVTRDQPQSGAAGQLANFLFNLIPSSNNLEMTSRMLKEYFGLFIYKLRGAL